MYFEQLTNVENERIEWEVEPARESEIEEVRRALQKMKRGKAVGPDDIPAGAWKCLEATARWEMLCRNDLETTSFFGKCCITHKTLLKT